ncbi:hypothetical protein NDU88_005119 [Pleurodeles waltl]|uniref:Uncharacterized protein n=1 Tax=Pleurodeles waltl TaxID=8319 RepID=A0AAV7SKW2_PLEWA|nr:hypothetical protein NDU88_005119 [Pleurodeles waltl]
MALICTSGSSSTPATPRRSGQALCRCAGTRRSRHFVDRWLQASAASNSFQRSSLHGSRSGFGCLGDRLTPLQASDQHESPRGGRGRLNPHGSIPSLPVLFFPACRAGDLQILRLSPSGPPLTEVAAGATGSAIRMGCVMRSLAGALPRGCSLNERQATPPTQPPTLDG